MLHKIVCQQRQSQFSFGALEASEMFAMKQISQRAHESSNKAVSYQAAEHVAQAITLLQQPFAILQHSGDCCYAAASLSW